jgi:AcrR family transcriptional regulator
VRKKILAQATVEFTKKGFRNASMTSIAQGAHITAANIYRYFQNKDALFEEVISSVIKRWDYLFKRMETEVMPQAYLLGVDLKKYDAATFNEEIEFIDSHREELYLIFFSTAGSKREKYVEELTDRLAKVNFQLLEAVREKSPKVVDFPMALMHIFTTMKIALYKEIIRSNLSKEDIRKLFESLDIVTQKGWQGLQDSSKDGLKK